MSPTWPEKLKANQKHGGFKIRLVKQPRKYFFLILINLYTRHICSFEIFVGALQTCVTSGEYTFCLRNKNIRQKQPSKSVLWKMCFENMQQIYRRISMPKCDHTLSSLFSCKFAAYFQNTFLYQRLRRAASNYIYKF